MTLHVCVPKSHICFSPPPQRSRTPPDSNAEGHWQGPHSLGEAAAQKVKGLGSPSVAAGEKGFDCRWIKLALYSWPKSGPQKDSLEANCIIVVHQSVNIGFSQI